eukprot:g9280.t1
MACLEFESVWVTPQGEREGIRLVFDILTAQTHVTIAGHQTQTTTCLHTVTPPTRRASVWDLYLNAEVELFGKRITLRQCTVSTTRWLEYWSARLHKTIAALEEEIRTADPVAAKSLDYVGGMNSGGLVGNGPKFSAGGNGSQQLRPLMLKAHRLQKTLAKSRANDGEPLARTTGGGKRLQSGAGLQVPPEMFEIEMLPMGSGGDA